MFFNKSFLQNCGYTLLLSVSIFYAGVAIAADLPPVDPPPDPPPPPPLTAPTDLTVTTQCSNPPTEVGSAQLNWNPPNSGQVAGYRISYGVTSSFGANLDVGSQTTYTFNSPPLVLGTNYFAMVQAYNADFLLGPPSATVTFVINGCVVNYSCDGFFAPLDDEDVAIAVKAKSKRAIPIKAQLLDSAQNIIGIEDLAKPPVVNVMFKPEVGDAVPVDEDDLVPKGESSFGNKFSYDVDTLTWQYNLDTSPLSKGTYTITMTSGDPSYQISPTCTGKFERQ